MKLNQLMALLVALATIHSSAFAQSGSAYPSRPITVIVPMSPGGTADLLARNLAPLLTEKLGQSVVIDNRMGANGAIGEEFFSRAKPDGYTLMLESTSIATNPWMSNLSYDPRKAFTPAILIAAVPLVLVVNNNVNAQTAKEFISLAKANPGQYNYASAGNGSASHLAMAYFDSMAGIDLVHIPTKGTGDAIAELLAGRAQAVIAANVAALPFANDPRIRFLGVSSEKPSPFVPGVPPIGNTLKGYVFDSWFGLLAPAGTPQEIIVKMQSQMAKLLKQPEIVERMRRQGIEIGRLTPNEFNQLLVGDYVRMAKVVKASGAKPD